jgi:ADP-ribose pyrophosphatase YjhB (NUDIX family)
MKATTAVNGAVFKDGQILLTRREDFEVWCMPSGAVEAGESIAQAALRETLEEIGIQVELTHLVGVFSRCGVLPDLPVTLFTARPVGGALRTQPGETIEVRYFPQDQLPADLLIGMRSRIQAAFEGKSGMAVCPSYRKPSRSPDRFCQTGRFYAKAVEGWTN